ncbi:DNA-binding MarR family transcriptional regulator [Natronospira proteinivora]|uniref:DNA-binding MarR family transcriptional regulator n=1 Tax=Natronospira proteinivora TaxID=1807133 RepID=A0ABT1G5N4_9GAMM|nr:MarR family transcriptional regulator [Natronospira proteinivora]MCP1726586.1 DNA-binding MarR family transcriptional regulator [Natronospira proteinivora]
MDRVDRILAQWRSERPDLDVGPMGTLGRMSRLFRYLREGMDKVFVEYGLSRASFDVLATLRRSGAPFALNPSTLIEWTMVTSGTMTNRIDRLVSAGLVERRRNPDDKRGFLIGLTDKGLALIEEAITAHVANQHHLTAALTEEEQQAFDRLIAKWLAAFEEDEH